MNPDTHQFEPITEETPLEWKRFKYDEVLYVKGIRFVVEAIETDRLILHPCQHDGNRHERRAKMKEEMRQLRQAEMKQLSETLKQHELREIQRRVGQDG